MKLGLICDVHEHLEYLQQALDQFAVCSVDRIVGIGDLFETGQRIDERSTSRPRPQQEARHDISATRGESHLRCPRACAQFQGLRTGSVGESPSSSGQCLRIRDGAIAHRAQDL